MNSQVVQTRSEVIKMVTCQSNTMDKILAVYITITNWTIPFYSTLCKISPAMADTTEQAKPFAHAALQSLSDEEEALSAHLKFGQRKYIKCCGCFTAFLLILAVTILVLFFTVFHVKEPVIRINTLTLNPERLLTNGAFRTNTNVTLVADISVKNPNYASFKFNNGTTTVFYGGKVVGEGRIPSEKAEGRRTTHMNITVNMNPDEILKVPSWVTDVISRVMTMNTSTAIDGKVKIFNNIKKKFAVQVNCTITYNLSSLNIQQNCTPHFLWELHYVLHRWLILKVTFIYIYI